MWVSLLPDEVDASNYHSGLVRKLSHKVRNICQGKVEVLVATFGTGC